MDERKVPSRAWSQSGWKRSACAAVLAGAGLASVGTGVLGCAVSESDVRRWETTERGPEKLVAVLTHDKYDWHLRTEAALSLVRMKPRGGRRIGHDLVSQALMSMPEDSRRKIVTAVTPELLKQIVAPRPPKNADGTWPPDPSIAYKDAAFALLSHEPPLINDDKSKADLTNGLIQWTQADFENRIENTSQRYGIEQMMRFFGPPAVRNLPALLTEESTKVDRISGLLADLADPEAKERASHALVDLAKRIESPEWVRKNTAIVEEANKRAKANVDEKGLKAQVTKFQDQELLKIFSAMKRVGGRPVIDYVLSYATDKTKSEDRRKAALAGLEGRLDKNRKEDVDKIVALAAGEETPDGLRDLAFARLGELPKDLLAQRVYPLFENKRWKIRWLAGSLLLKTLSTKQIPEFMRRLPANPATKMAMTEPITYGSQMARIEPAAGEPKPREVVTPYLSAAEIGPKLTALSVFYGGKKADQALVKPFEDDKNPVPKCEEADECGWACTVPKAPGSPEMEAKPITTVGEFVKYCVIPSMESP